MKLTEEDHIYATLSETFGSLSSLNDDYLIDHQRCSSVTTVANDDFEFHDPRVNIRNKIDDRQFCQFQSHGVMQSQVKSEGISIRPPAELPIQLLDPSSSSTTSPVSSFRSSSSEESSLEEIHRRNVLNKNEERNKKDDLSSLQYTLDTPQSDTLEKKRYILQQAKEEILEDVIEEQADKISDIITDYKSDINSSTGTLSRKHRSSSLSMNDLDRLDGSETSSEEQMMFILPMKSESMLSLYRLYLAEDEDDGSKSLHYSLEVSRSEGDLSLTAINRDRRQISDSSSNLDGGKSEGALHEVYQKRKPSSETGGSRIRRQHKIQRAKVVQQRARSNLQSSSSTNLSDSGVSLSSSIGLSPVGIQRTSGSSTTEGLQVAVMDKSRRRNGIITIQDPSVLSVEELFKVLDRASCNSKINDSKEGTDVKPNISGNNVKSEVTSTTEYKKIFVSEYL